MLSTAKRKVGQIWMVFIILLVIKNPFLNIISGGKHKGLEKSEFDR